MFNAGTDDLDMDSERLEIEAKGQSLTYGQGRYNRRS